MDVTAIKPQRLLQRAGRVQDVLRAMPQTRSLCGAALCLAIRQLAKTAAQPHTDVLRPQDDTLENTEVTFNKDYNATEREALKCATFLLSVFQSHPTLRNVCAEELPTAMLNFWMEAERKAEQAPQALPSPKAEEAVSEAGTFSQKERPEIAAQSLSETTSCNDAPSMLPETEPEADCHEPAFPSLPSTTDTPEEAVDTVGNGVQNTEIHLEHSRRGRRHCGKRRAKHRNRRTNRKRKVFPP